MRDLLVYHGLKLPNSGGGSSLTNPISGITKIELVSTSDGQTEWSGLTIPTGELLAFYMGSVLQEVDYTYTSTTFTLVEGVPDQHELLLIILTPGAPTTVDTRVVGEIKMVAVTGSLDPGWVVCDGMIYDVVDYPDAIARLGTTYGGNGVSTFGVPDFRGRVPIAVAPDRVMSTKGGVANVTLNTGNIPAHYHNIAIPATTSNAGPTTTPDSSKIFGVDSPGSAGIYSSENPNTAMEPFQSGLAGVGEPFSIMQPYLVVNFIIYLGHPA